MTIREIIGLLQQLSTAHEGLLVLAGQKKEALVRDDVNQLTTILNKEAKLLKHIAALDQARADGVRDYMKSKGYMVTSGFTIATLSQMVADLEEKTALKQERQRLLDMIDKLKRANDINQQLISQSLAFIDYSVDLLMASPQQEAFYQHPQQQSGATAVRGLFDTKA